MNETFKSVCFTGSLQKQQTPTATTNPGMFDIYKCHFKLIIIIINYIYIALF